MNIKTINNKIPWGITLIFFGMLFFIRETGLIPEWSEFFNVKNYPIYAGIVFLITRNFKIAAVLFGLAILLRFGQIIELTRSFSNYIWPILLIAAGILLILSRKISGK